MRNWITLSSILLLFIPSLLKGQGEGQVTYWYKEGLQEKINHDSVKRLRLSQWVLANKDLPADLATFSQLEFLSISPPIWRRDNTELLGTLYTYRKSKLKHLSGDLAKLPHLSTLKITLNRSLDQRKLLQEIQGLSQLTSLTIELKKLNNHVLRTFSHLKNLRTLRIDLYGQRPVDDPIMEKIIKALPDCEVEFFYSGKPFTSIEGEYHSNRMINFLIGIRVFLRFGLARPSTSA